MHGQAGRLVADLWLILRRCGDRCIHLSCLQPEIKGEKRKEKEEVYKCNAPPKACSQKIGGMSMPSRYIHGIITMVKNEGSQCVEGSARTLSRRQAAMETSNTIPFLLSMMITDETHFILCAFIFFLYWVGICDVNEPFGFFPLKLGKNQLIA